MRVGTFDKNNRLVAAREVAKPKKSDVPCGDLPADGSYYYDPGRAAFFPVGFGQGKPKRPGVDRDRAVYLALTALLDGRPIPHECRQWCDWYEKHGRGR